MLAKCIKIAVRNLIWAILMKAFKELMSWIVPIAIGLLLALLIKQFAFQFVRVDGPSMQPNLQNNDRVVCLKQAKIHRGSVVVFDANGVDPQVSVKTEYVKRVIGLPGDTVEAKNGNLYVNGKKVDQSYISKSERSSGTGTWTLHSISQENSWVLHNGAYKASTLSWVITAASLTTAATGDSYLRARSSASSR